MGQPWGGKLEKIDDYRWRIPRAYKPGMQVEGIILASEEMLPAILEDQSPEQVANVACLPGIIGHSLAMPDIHYGYGFCIGGVAAGHRTGEKHGIQRLSLTGGRFGMRIRHRESRFRYYETLE